MPTTLDIRRLTDSPYSIEADAVRGCLCEFAELDDRRVNTHQRYPSKDIVQLVDDLKGRDGRNGADCRKLVVDPYWGLLAATHAIDPVAEGID